MRRATGPGLRRNAAPEAQPGKRDRLSMVHESRLRVAAEPRSTRFTSMYQPRSRMIRNTTIRERQHNRSRIVVLHFSSLEAPIKSHEVSQVHVQAMECSTRDSCGSKCPGQRHFFRPTALTGTSLQASDPVASSLQLSRSSHRSPPRSRRATLQLSYPSLSNMLLLAAGPLSRPAQRPGAVRSRQEVPTARRAPPTSCSWTAASRGPHRQSGRRD